MEAPKGDFSFEPPFVGYGSDNGEKGRPYWVLKVKDEEKYFIFNEQYEQGRWVPYFDEIAWRQADNFEYEDRQKKVIFSTNNGLISTKTIYSDRADIAFTEKEARWIMAKYMFMKQYPDRDSHSLVSVVPRLFGRLPVWFGLAVNLKKPEDIFYCYLEVRHQSDYDGEQFKRCEADNMHFAELQEGACYLLSTEYSSVDNHRECPLMAVRFNGTNFEYVPLSKAGL